MLFPLACHPGTPSVAVRGISVRLQRTPGNLRIAYRLEAELARLRIPARARPRIGERLWQHTCFEVFVAPRMPAYHEFNFSPSGEWAARAFSRYREGAPLDDAALDPGVTVRTGEDGLQLDALIRLDRISPQHATAMLSLALSAVIEDEGGKLSYWALEHPPGKPDFHHPDAFALELDEIRN